MYKCQYKNDQKVENKNVQSRLACYCIHGGVIHERSIKDSAQNSQIE